MARPRKATNVLELKGAFKKNPQRARKNEPQPEGKFNKNAPRHLLPDQKKTWRELIKAIPAGVLTSADRIHVEVVACLLAEYRGCGGLVKTDRITRLCSEMGKLGLTPSGRAGLQVEKPKKNKYD